MKNRQEFPLITIVDILCLYHYILRLNRSKDLEDFVNFVNGQRRKALTSGSDLSEACPVLHFKGQFRLKVK
jgi:hypothetical protein